MKLLLVAATAAEIQQTLDFLGLTPGETGMIKKGDQEIHLLISGVGLMPATFSLTRKLSAGHFDFVLQAGIGGLYATDIAAEEIELGDLVAIRSEYPGDLGAEDHENYISIFELGFLKPDEPPFSNGRLVNPMTGIPFSPLPPLVDGMTVHTVSGHATTIARRYKDHTLAAESMEGAALHYVCLQLGIPFLQIRAISNYVTPRDRSSWQIGKAIKSLNDLLSSWLG